MMTWHGNVLAWHYVIMGECRGWQYRTWGILDSGVDDVWLFELDVDEAPWLHSSCLGKDNGRTMRKLLSGHASTSESWFTGKMQLHSLGDSEETRHAAMFRMEGKREPRLAMYFMCKKTDELWCQLSGKMGCNGCIYFPFAFYSERWRALQNPIGWQSNAANFRSYVYVIHAEISSHLSEGEMFDPLPTWLVLKDPKVFKQDGGGQFWNETETKCGSFFK